MGFAMNPEYSSGSHAWYGWRAITGKTTPSTPTGMGFKFGLYLFAQGPNGQIYFNSYLGTKPTPWLSIPGLSTAAKPVPVVYNGGLYLFVRGTDNQIWINSSSDAI